MRVLLVSGSLPPMKCGVGDYTARLAKALARRGDTSVAVLTDSQATPTPSDFEFEVFAVADGWKLADAIQIAKVTRRWRPDVVHVQYPTQGYGTGRLPWLLPALFRAGNLPIVQTLHEYPLKRNLFNAVLSGGLIAVRPDYKATMPKWYQWLIRKKQFGFIPNASAIPTVRLNEAERLATHLQFAPMASRLVAYFGFIHLAKRVELLFEVADPLQHHLVLVGELNSEDEYHKRILYLINRQPWIGKVTVTGFLPAEEAGRILAAADAVVLPFRDGGGIWNTSIHASLAQGTFVLTTSREQHGYDCTNNIYYARPADVDDMSLGLRTHIGSRLPGIQEQASDWETIADAHVALYSALL